MKIYTKTGDAGTTSLAGGKRLEKSNLQIEAYGTIDELNSVLGLAIEEVRALPEDAGRDSLLGMLCQMQDWLFTVGGILATEADSWEKYWDRAVIAGWTAEMEALIDRFTAELPELRSFVLPGGSRCAATLHIARTVARRGERCICRFATENNLCNPLLTEVSKFVNRISDFFFVAARKALQVEGKPETAWRPAK